ncbi:hypothetical protein C8R43DRAFT_1241254 [Mycena crocata]|nr:hypothetical protein C8R43DRAFT_1241254 [Mycena crocata]
MNTPTTTLSLSNLIPNDVVLVILELCSPGDLIQISRTSQGLKSLLDTSQTVWDSAQKNLARGVATRVPARPVVEASGNFGELAYATWIFGGGKCSVCTKWTDSLPENFLFRFRDCSDKCQKSLRLSEAHQRPILVHYGKQLDPWVGPLPRSFVIDVPNLGDLFRFSVRDLNRAKKEYHYSRHIACSSPYKAGKHFCARTAAELDQEYVLREQARPELTSNAAQLEDWKINSAQSSLAKLLKSVPSVKSHAVAHGIKVRCLMRCPMLARVFDAFYRDLEPITLAAWTHLLPFIKEQLNPILKGIFPEGAAIRQTDRIRCPHCPRVLNVTGITAHIVEKHPEHNPDGAVPGLKLSARKHCRKCPKSQKIFSERGLASHMADK